MYNFCFRYHQLDYVYLAFEIKEQETAKAMDAVRLLGMRGCNVTMPCKTEVTKYLDVLSPAVRIIGAANTIVNDHGVLTGYNTDGIGFIRNLKEHGVSVWGKRIVLLGAGGAATAILVQSALDGAASLSVFNRSAGGVRHIEETAERLKEEAPDTKVRAFFLEDEKALAQEIQKADILINGTKVGMSPNDDATLITDRSLFRPQLVVADVICHPLETKLLREAKEAGCQNVIGGKGMLLWQGAAAYELYTGLPMPVEAYQEYLELKRNNLWGNHKYF